MKGYLRRVGNDAQLNPRAYLRRAYCEVMPGHMVGHFLHCGYGHGVLEKPSAPQDKAAAAAAATAAAAAIAVAAASAAVAVAAMMTTSA